MKKTACVDFDGVIHAYRKGWQGGDIYDDPVHGAFEGIGQLIREGWAVCIFSTRDPFDVTAWMNEMLIERYPGEAWFCDILPDDAKFWNGGTDGNEVAVTNRKIPAIVYLDDRGVRFDGHWQDVPALLRHFKTWQER